MIQARVRAGLSQADLALRMGTSQPYIARLESGRTWPSLRTIFKVAAATGTTARLELVAAERRGQAAGQR